MSLREMLSRLLKSPEVYLAVQHLVGAMKSRKICLGEYAEIQSGHRVLDVGCGPGYALELL